MKRIVFIVIIVLFALRAIAQIPYLTSGLYLNGAITTDNRLFLCSNTWWVRYRGGHDTY